MSRFKLIYFGVMGRGEPIRYIFAQAGVAYDDYRFADEEWDTLKKKMPMAAVPVLEVDGKPLCQTNAICGYLGSLFNLGGKDALETAKCYMYAGGVEDVWAGMTPYFEAENPEEKKRILETNIEKLLKPFLARFDKFLAENGTGYLVGNSVTWADFVLYHGSGFAFHLYKEKCKLSDYANLQKFHATISNLPKIKEWIEKRPNADWC